MWKNGVPCESLDPSPFGKNCEEKARSLHLMLRAPDAAVRLQRSYCSFVSRDGYHGACVVVPTTVKSYAETSIHFKRLTSLRPLLAPSTTLFLSTPYSSPSQFSAPFPLSPRHQSFHATRDAQRRSGTITITREQSPILCPADNIDKKATYDARMKIVRVLLSNLVFLCAFVPFPPECLSSGVRVKMCGIFFSDEA